jgi:Zn finger protein HypA/HybF involved in hydrogenase expression
MARFRCRACGEEGEFEYRPGEHACPRCGDHNVQIALSIAELPDDDPIIEQIERLADTKDDE